MKKNVTKAREKFINSCSPAERFEVHGDKYYYADNYLCLSLPIIESTITVNDNGYHTLFDIINGSAKRCCTPLALPTLAELKSYRKTWAEFNKCNKIDLKKSQFIYQWADGIALKLDFMILIMEMIPDLVLMAEKANRIIYGYSKSCGAEVAVCPVRVHPDHQKITDIHSFDEWKEARQAVNNHSPAEVPEAPAEPAPEAPAPAPDWVGKTMTAYPKKPKKPDFVGRKMIITIGERSARPA